MVKFTGSKYDPKLRTEDIIKLVRQDLAKAFPKEKGYKFSVRKPRYNTIDVTVLEVPFQILRFENAERILKYDPTLKNDDIFTPDHQTFIKNVNDIVEAYNNYEHEPMQDYCQSNFYHDVHVAELHVKAMDELKNITVDVSTELIWSAHDMDPFYANILWKTRIALVKRETGIIDYDTYNPNPDHIQQINRLYTTSEDFIEKWKDKVNWDNISANQKLSEAFIEKWKDKVNWNNMSEYQKLSEDFIEKWKDKVDWNYISVYQKLSEAFIEKWKDKVNWTNISVYQKLSEGFIEKWKDNVNWDYISAYQNQKLSEGFIEKWKDKVNWDYISEYQKLAEDFIEKWQDKMNWNNISAYQKLSGDFIEKWKDKVDWNRISTHQKLSEGFIEKWKDKVNWTNISEYQKLSEDFIEKWKDNVNWDYISAYQKLSEGFIETWKDKVNWDNISLYQKLSEGFIEKWKDNVNWTSISAHQKLSEGFIEKWKDKVNWDYISEYQKLSEGFIEKWKDKVNWDNISARQKLSEAFIEKWNDKVYWVSISANQKLSEPLIERWKDKVNWDSISKNISIVQEDVSTELIWSAEKYTAWDVYGTILHVGDRIVSVKAERLPGYQLIMDVGEKFIVDKITSNNIIELGATDSVESKALGFAHQSTNFMRVDDNDVSTELMWSSGAIVERKNGYELEWEKGSGYRVVNKNYDYKSKWYAYLEGAKRLFEKKTKLPEKVTLADEEPVSTELIWASDDFKVGDKVTVTAHHTDIAGLDKYKPGDVLTVTEVYGSFVVIADNNGEKVELCHQSRFKKIVEEPVSTELIWASDDFKVGDKVTLKDDKFNQDFYEIKPGDVLTVVNVYKGNESTFLYVEKNKKVSGGWDAFRFEKIEEEPVSTELIWAKKEEHLETKIMLFVVATGLAIGGLIYLKSKYLDRR